MRWGKLMPKQGRILGAGFWIQGLGFRDCEVWGLRILSFGTFGSGLQI